MNESGCPPIVWSRLDPPGTLFGVSCDEDGPSIGPIRLLRRTEVGLEPRPAEELDFIFKRALDCSPEFTKSIRGLRSVAKALQEGNLAHAMIVTQFM